MEAYLSFENDKECTVIVTFRGFNVLPSRVRMEDIEHFHWAWKIDLGRSLNLFFSPARDAFRRSNWVAGLWQRLFLKGTFQIFGFCRNQNFVIHGCNYVGYLVQQVWVIPSKHLLLAGNALWSSCSVKKDFCLLGEIIRFYFKQFPMLVLNCTWGCSPFYKVKCEHPVQFLPQWSKQKYWR